MTDKALRLTRSARDKRHFNKPLLQKKAKGLLVSVLRFALIVCLSYLILAPILRNLTQAFTHPDDLGMATSIWLPQRISTQNWHVSLLMLDYWKALPYTFLHTSIMVLLQTLCAMLAGYSFARFKFRFRGLLFAFVVFTIIVPPQVFMMPQYLFFRKFDIFGIITLITGKPLNLSGDWEEELLLSAQRGAGLAFVFMAEEPLVLHDTTYSDYFGASYPLWAQQAKEIITDYQRTLGNIFHLRITGFEQVNDQVTITTYEDGSRVAVNFGQEDLAVDEQTVPARSYILLEGREGE